jgi:phosphoglycolate phosphatase-like HAD superfamily hydrolase
MFADTADCKPSPALLHKAAQLLQLDMKRAVFIGDRDTDMQTAWNAEIPALLVRTGDGPLTEKNLGPAARMTVYDDLNSAVDHLLKGTPHG